MGKPRMPAVTTQERTELAAWRLLGEDLAPQLDAWLAAHGDFAPRELIQLQHALTDLRTARQPRGEAPQS